MYIASEISEFISSTGKSINGKLFTMSKIPVLTKLFIVFIVIMTYILIYNYTTKLRFEGFESNIESNVESNNQMTTQKFDMRNNVPGIYDKFYCGIYDQLVLNESKNHFELETLKKYTTLNKETSRILDIGSGTGHHVNLLNSAGYQSTGLDASTDMVDQSIKSFPESKFVLGDTTDSMLFQQGQFSHIMCLYFTIYYIQDMQRFFANCHAWIEPGGYLLLHLVDRDKFDPVIPAGSPFVIVPPQKYANERVVDTSVKFKDFQYTSKFDINVDNDTAVFKETFTDDRTGTVRKHEHSMKMPTQKTILNLAKREGFILESMRRMAECGYEDQYLYTLQRTN